MKIACIGGGPGGLYFSILFKKTYPEAQIDVFERNPPHETFGFGVVFSDASLSRIAQEDLSTYQEISAKFSYWDDIDIFVHGECIRSGGHGFCGLSRHTLLQILQNRASALGVHIEYQTEIKSFDDVLSQYDLVIACDGVHSAIRQQYADQFKPKIKMGQTRFTWMGTTKPFDAFTFYFKENEAGLWRVHAYRYEEGKSTFIIETSNEAWLKAGMDQKSEAESAAYFENLFAQELEGHRILTNKSIWRQFPLIKNENWWIPKLVLLGDAVHTAHFSIGSGTKLAVEDASVLLEAFKALNFQTHELDRVNEVLAYYQKIRKPQVESLQKSAETSQKWFEETEKYFKLPADDFAFSLLTRSLRISHSNLKLRDQNYILKNNQNFGKQAFQNAGVPIPKKWQNQDIPPMFTPFKIRNLVIPNRVALSPMCQYQATDGLLSDWHIVHYGSRAIGGNGLIFSEMTAVSAEGRITPGCAGIYTDAHQDAWARVNRFIHEHSSAKTCLQLGHAGRKAATKKMWEGIDQPLAENEAWPLLSASAIPYFAHSQVPKALDETDMAQIKADFIQATQRGINAGFDMLELHCAHGYLLASFLSPLTNLRTDQYGGSVENRLRFPLEVFKAIRALTDLPISVRLSATDWAENGLSNDDLLLIATAFKEAGADLLNLSTGQTTATAKPEYGRLYQTPFAELVKLEVNIPTCTAGMISSFEDVNSVIMAKRADLCLVARAQLFDPYWVFHSAFEQEIDLALPPSYCVVQSPYVPKMEWSARGMKK